MVKLFGDFDNNMPVSEGFLILGFLPTSIPLKQRWRNTGLSADFLADYLVTFFPTNETDERNSLKNPAEIKNAVSYIANELLENAMKFSNQNASYPITLKLHLHPRRIVFCITNSISYENMNKFQQFIEKMISSDPQELYICQLEENAKNDKSTESKLGLLTMVNDYMAKIGWKFEIPQEEPKLITVSTMVQLTV